MPAMHLFLRRPTLTFEVSGVTSLAFATAREAPGTARRPVFGAVASVTGPASAFLG